MDKSLTARLQRFTAARFSPGEAFGLHLTLGVLALLLAMAGFARIAGAVVDGSPITEVDLRLAAWLHTHAHASDGLRTFLLGVTHLHSTPGVMALTAVAAYWLYRRGARDWMLTLLVTVPGGMLLNVAMKHTFERARPHFDEPILTLTTYSFPSGHSVAATLLYGLLACYFTRHARSWGARAAIITAACAMIALVAGSRLYLGAHYLSDVLAGMAEGCAWLAICVTGTATFRRRRAWREGRNQLHDT
ncbi:phosphatase PAP2 family protein [Massilia niabensis]|uniref:Phosphatase PAP2 family protein n=1 Tax=Massilia niabensis TaxID=544910 RepID=A0ABW0L2H8_9BURK